MIGFWSPHWTRVMRGRSIVRNCAVSVRLRTSLSRTNQRVRSILPRGGCTLSTTGRWGAFCSARVPSMARSSWCTWALARRCGAERLGSLCSWTGCAESAGDIPASGWRARSMSGTHQPGSCTNPLDSRRLRDARRGCGRCDPHRPRWRHPVHTRIPKRGQLFFRFAKSWKRCSLRRAESVAMLKRGCSAGRHALFFTPREFATTICSAS